MSRKTAALQKKPFSVDKFWGVMLRLISKKITSRIGELMKNLNELTFFEEPWLAWLDCSGNSLAEVDMKNGSVTDTWERDPGTVFQNGVF